MFRKEQRKKVAFVDFDGVILTTPNVKSQTVLKHVSDFTKVALNSQRTSYRLSDKTINIINQELYTAYGHTVLGVNRMLCSGTLSASSPHAYALDDFNHMVYDTVTVEQSNRKENEMSDADACAWRGFLTQMKQVNIPVYIFSNAPLEWCETFIDMSEVDGFICDDKWTKSSSFYVKPYPQIYRWIENKFPDTDLLFWDDKMINFKSCMHDPRWKKVLVNKNFVAPGQCTPHFFYTPCIEDIPQTLILQ
jgi:beta-phosphoglucomutase-like phosphatase (HAD superfamily)